MPSAAERLLYAVDLFKKPLYFTYRGRESFTTGCGVIWSLVFVFIMLTVSLFDFVDLMVAPISGVSITRMYQDANEASLDLHEGELFYAFGFYDELPPEIGSVKFEHVSRKLGGDFEVSVMPQKQCTIEIQSLQYKGMFCIDLEASNPEHGIVSGNYFSNHFSYIKASFKPCFLSGQEHCASKNDTKLWL
jgi:hypothetical protein